MDLSLDQILQLSPDDASAKAAKGLVIPGKWPTLRFNEAALWGECQGSGSKPYQVQVDKSGPAFRCSCPSRKFPCKHGLALLMLWQQNRVSFTAGEPPSWVAEWLASRQTRAEKQEAKKADVKEAAVPADPRAAAKREAVRHERMAAGLADLELWLMDSVRQGLGQLNNQSPVFEALARRMVDAQLPGVAQRLRTLAAAVGRDQLWPARMLGGLGQLQLLIEGFQRIQNLPAGVQADLRAALGINLDREEVLAQGMRVTDQWLVLGQSCYEDDRLWVRRLWLRGQGSGRWALLLDFSHGTRRFDLNLLNGSSVCMTLAFYPGAAPLRAVPVDTPEILVADASPPQLDEAQVAAELAAAIAANPWQSPRPLLLGELTPLAEGSIWRGLTAGRQLMTLRLRDADAWQLIAEAGGSPLSLFGEWDGEALRPLTAWAHGLIWQEGVTS